MMRRLVGAVAASALALGWAGWLALIPSLAGHADAGPAVVAAAAASYRLGGLVCHQQAGRSFHVGRVQLPVCARCTGLYAGAALGGAAAVAWLIVGRVRKRPSQARLSAVRRVIVLGALPTVLLWLGEHGLGMGIGGAVRASGALLLGATVWWFAVSLIGGARFTDGGGPGRGAARPHAGG